MSRSLRQVARTAPSVLRHLRLLAPIIPLGLVAAAPIPPDRQPGEGAPADRLVTVYDWTSLLPAPPTPDSWSPGPGPRLTYPLRGVVTQAFGCTGFALESPMQDCPAGFHSGLDIAQAQGSPVRSAALGLAYPFADRGRYGNHVVVQHLGGYSTVYAHLIRADVAWGQTVRAGDLIGWVGSTGNSTGPHLHFEVRFAGAPLDPGSQLDGAPADPFPLPAGWPGAPRDDWRGKR